LLARAMHQVLSAIGKNSLEMTVEGIMIWFPHFVVGLSKIKIKIKQ